MTRTPSQNLSKLPEGDWSREKDVYGGKRADTTRPGAWVWEKKKRRQDGPIGTIRKSPRRGKGSLHPKTEKHKR